MSELMEILPWYTGAALMLVSVLLLASNFARSAS